MLSGKIPYGYRMEKGKYVVQQDEANIVLWIFDMRKQGTGVYAIGKMLFEKQVPFFSDSRDKAIKKVSAILYKPIYAGDSEYPQIVDKELFEKIQKLKPAAFRKTVGKSALSAKTEKTKSEMEYCYQPDEEIANTEEELRQLLTNGTLSSEEIRQRIMALAAQKYACIKEKGDKS